MFKSRDFIEDDYKSYEKWLHDRGRVALDYEDLPHLGKTVLVGDDPICAGFIHRNDSSICSIGNLASDGSRDKELRGRAVDYLIDELIIDVKNLGYKMVTVTTNKSKLLDRLYDRGFDLFDSNLVQVGRAL